MDELAGTAAAGLNATHLLNDYEQAKATFGNYDAFSAGTLNLTRGLELAYQNGARTAYARGLAAGADQAAFASAFTELLKEDVQLLIAPELTTAAALDGLGALCYFLSSQAGRTEAPPARAAIGGQPLEGTPASPGPGWSFDLRLALSAALTAQPGAAEIAVPVVFSSEIPGLITVYPPRIEYEFV